MLQKAAARHSVDQPIPNFDGFRFEDPAHLRPSLRVAVIGSGEATEVELAFENRRGLQKSLLVHWIRMMVHIPPLKGRAHLAAMESVLVGFGNGVEARMKVASNFFDTRDTNVWRKQPVERFF